MRVLKPTPHSDKPTVTRPNLQIAPSLDRAYTNQDSNLAASLIGTMHFTVLGNYYRNNFFLLLKLFQFCVIYLPTIEFLPAVPFILVFLDFCHGRTCVGAGLFLLEGSVFKAVDLGRY